VNKPPKFLSVSIKEFLAESIGIALGDIPDAWDILKEAWGILPLLECVKVESAAFQKYGWDWVRFATGIPRVGFSHTVPKPADTVPMLGIHLYRPVIHVVLNETRGTYGTRSFFSLKYSKYIIGSM
jgi:hypothetical protein